MTDLGTLRQALEHYAPLEDATWKALAGFSRGTRLQAGEFFTKAGEEPRCFGFVIAGLLRCYAITESGDQYNKNFFEGGSFPGSMVALLNGGPSAFAIEALEPSSLLSIDFAKYRALLAKSPDLMWFQIRYLEANWLLAKEPREVSFVQESATERYLRFQREHPALEARIAQYHLASHLGITPTQLSRIRRDLRAQAT